MLFDNQTSRSHHQQQRKQIHTRSLGWSSWGQAGGLKKVGTTNSVLGRGNSNNNVIVSTVVTTIVVHTNGRLLGRGDTGRSGGKASDGSRPWLILSIQLGMIRRKSASDVSKGGCCGPKFQCRDQSVATKSSLVSPPIPPFGTTRP
jgi:hypothetical protein